MCVSNDSSPTISSSLMSTSWSPMGATAACNDAGSRAGAGGRRRQRRQPEVAASALVGPGIDLRTGRPSPHHLAVAVRRILAEPNFADRAPALQAEMARTRPLDTVIEVLLTLAETTAPKRGRVVEDQPANWLTALGPTYGQPGDHSACSTSWTVRISMTYRPGSMRLKEIRPAALKKSFRS